MLVDASVLITCFNKEEFLDEAVTSVKRQTKQPKEIIIVHDKCDQPQAHALADTIILRDNLGVAKARHEAFRFSTGSLILFLDGDDVIDPDFLEKTILTIADGADIAYPDTYFWDWQGDGSSLFVTPKVLDAKFVSEHKKTTLPVTCLMKRGVYETLEGFRELPLMEDLDFFLRAMCNDYTFKKAETLLWYRQTPGTRNRHDMRAKAKVYNDIIKQFKFEEGKVSHV